MPFDSTDFKIGLTEEQLADLRIIRLAREQIAMDDQWCQRRFTDGLQQRCAVGWLTYAIHENECVGTGLRFVCSDQGKERLNHITETYFNPMIPRRFPKSLPTRDQHGVIWYNDLKRTKHSHVVALFDKVIQNLENQNAI